MRFDGIHLHCGEAGLDIERQTQCSQNGSSRSLADGSTALRSKMAAAFR